MGRDMSLILKPLKAWHISFCSTAVNSGGGPAMADVELMMAATIPMILSSRLFEICLASAYDFGCFHPSMDNAGSLTGLQRTLSGVSGWVARSASEALVLACLIEAVKALALGPTVLASMGDGGL